MDVMSNFAARYERTREEVLSLQDYLELCKREPVAYASAAERMLKAIGEPQMIDTRNDPRLSRIFANKVIRIYPAFKEFYGMEDAIEQVVSYFRHAAQGLEEKKQILYLLGPVGGGKSSIAERLAFASCYIDRTVRIMDRADFVKGRRRASARRSSISHRRSRRTRR